MFPPEVEGGVEVEVWVSTTNLIENNHIKNGTQHSQETLVPQRIETEKRTAQKMVDLKEPCPKNIEEKGLDLEIDLEIGLTLVII